MVDFRCTCKKLIFQIENDAIIIKCRHCKRYVHIQTKGILGMQTGESAEKSHLRNAAVSNLQISSYF